MHRLLIPLSILCFIAHNANAQCLGTQRVDAGYELVNNDVCEGFEITVRNTSDNNGNSNVIYIWDWGDGQKDTLGAAIEANHTYNFTDLDACSADGGLAIAELRLDAIVPGCPQFNHFVIKPIFVFLRPVAQFEAPAQLCLPETSIDFKNTSCTADTSATYRWDFGDPASGAANTSTEFEPTHDFSGPGEYLVTLTVESNCGSASFSQMIEVLSTPVVDITYDRVPESSCLPLRLDINNQSTGALTYEWSVSPNQGFSFTDSTSQFSTSPKFLFFQSGTYTIRLRMTNDCGPSTWEETIDVLEPPAITLTPEPVACEELMYEPNVEYAGTVSQVRWTFEGGTPGTSTERNPTGIIFPPGQHVVTLEASSVCGSVTLFDTIIVLNRENVTIEPVAPPCNSAQPIQLTATPTGGTWSGNGVSANGVFNPAIANIGINTLTYTVGSASCEATGTIDIDVKQAVAIDPGADETVCIDATPFQLSDFSPAGGYWQGEGIIDSIQATFSPEVAGTGNKRLTYFYFDETNSCTATAEKTINVAALPTADIAEDEIPVCITDADIRLTDNLSFNVSNNGSGSWSGAGIVDETAGLFNTSALAPGTYNLLYTHTSNAGCIARDSVDVTVSTPQSVTAQTDTTVCISAGTLTLQSTPTGGRWTGSAINANSGEINLTQAGGGTRTYTYTIFGGTTCEVSDQVDVNIIDLSGVSAGSDVGFCESESIVTLQNFTPAGGRWSGAGIVDDSLGRVDIQPLTPGNYTLTYQIESESVVGCAAQDQIVLTVHELPEAGFRIEGQQCTNEAFQFIDTSINAQSYVWDFDDGRTSTEQNPEVSFATAGNYNIKLAITSPQGCVDTARQMIRITEPPPAVAFDVNTRGGCADLEVQFTNLSQGEDISYRWDFGNGQMDSVANPEPVVYTAAFGDTAYVARLSVVNGCGGQEFVDTIKVQPRPIADFGTTFNNFCSGDVVEVQNASLGLPESYFWDFGNGRTTREEQPNAQTYFTGDTPTDYTITLIAVNGCGRDTLSRTVTINPTDVEAFFSVAEPEFCVGDTVRLTSFATPGARVRYEFGDGTISTEANPEHVYDTAGMFRIVQYSIGCGFDSTEVAINIKPLPEIAMIVDDVTCIESNVTFNYESDQNVNPDWDFGDGNASTLANPVHSYDTTGVYNIRLAVIGPNGCANAVERAIEIVPLPEFELVATDSLCVGEAGNFIVNSNDNISSYAWAFGDGERGTGSSLQYAYARQGTYTTAVTVTDGFGCMTSQQQSVFVRPTPEAAFDFTRMGDCTPTEIAFANQSKSANSYTWNFQDGNTSSQVNPRYVYYEGGDFNVQLIASFDGICFDTTAQNITINEIPNIDFQTKDLTCHGSDDGSIEVLDDQGNDITVYGDDFVQRGVNLFSGLELGFYDIEVTAASGCDTIYMVEIFEPDSLIMTVRLDTVTIVPGDTVRLEIFSNYTDLAYTWFPDTSITQFGKNLFYAYPQRSVLYELIGTTGDCSVRDFVYVEVDRERKIYIPNAFSPNGDGVNDFFYIFAGDGVEEVASLQIFQRFGDLVYQRENFDPNDPSAAWDGTHRGKMLNSAVFVYKAVIRFKDGRSEEFVGDVTLVR